MEDCIFLQITKKTDVLKCLVECLRVLSWVHFFFVCTADLANIKTPPFAMYADDIKWYAANNFNFQRIRM